MGRRPRQTGDSLAMRRNIILDVGGERFTASRDIIQNFPATRYKKGNIVMTIPPICLYQAG